MLKKSLLMIAGTMAMSFSLGATASASTFSFGGSKYFLTEGLGTWSESQAEAESKGGNLVTINDAAEQNWLASTFGEIERFWIGLNDVASEGDYVWVSGEPVTYTNWASGEPNNSFNGGATNPEGEDYTVMNWTAPENWNDLPDAGPSFQPARGIIEVKHVPEPASLLGLAAIGGIAAGGALRKKAAA